MISSILCVLMETSVRIHIFIPPHWSHILLWILFVSNGDPEVSSSYRTRLQSHALPWSWVCSLKSIALKWKGITIDFFIISPHTKTHTLIHLHYDARAHTHTQTHTHTHTHTQGTSHGGRVKLAPLRQVEPDISLSILFPFRSQACEHTHTDTHVHAQQH